MPQAANKKIEEMVEESLMDLKFDPSWIVDLMEKKLIEITCHQSLPLINIPGRLLITDSRFYFQPLYTIDPEPVLKFEFKNVTNIVRRRHGLRHIGIEIFTNDECSIFFSFKE